MNIQDEIRKVINQSMTTLGAHSVTINGSTIQAIPAEVDTDRELMGGSRESREIVYEFPTIAGLNLQKGMAVKSQGKSWKIESFRKGTGMTSIRLIEPNRVD
jgi:hypothetical protein